MTSISLLEKCKCNKDLISGKINGGFTPENYVFKHCKTLDILIIN